jgi:formiminotetrahydrofolate cyclodeaminase
VSIDLAKRRLTPAFSLRSIPSPMTEPATANKPLTQLLDDLAAKTPTPGGGAVASITGALAGALAGMVVSYSVNKKSLAKHKPDLERAAEALARARALLLELAAEDEAAYTDLNALWKLDESDPRRSSAMPAAVERAIQAPRAVLAACLNLLRLLEELAPITNRSLRSDLAIAAILAEAGARAAQCNVAVNSPMLEKPDQRQRIESETAREVADARERTARVEAACR